MKKKDFITIIRKLNPRFPSMTSHGPSMLVFPIEDVLKGIYFEGSSFDRNSFYVWFYWLPLYVPTEGIYFNLGKRIRSENCERWNADKPGLLDELTAAINCKVIPLLGELETPHDVVDIVRKKAIETNDLYVHQALSYALIRVGETEEAVNAINTLVGFVNSNVAWQVELGIRANLLKKKLLQRVEDAEDMLEHWRIENICKLGLESIAKSNSTTE